MTAAAAAAHRSLLTIRRPPSTTCRPVTMHPVELRQPHVHTEPQIPAPLPLPPTHATEDSISIWRSSNVTVARGLVDGNNSPTGAGVMFEGSEEGVTGGLLEDVDAVHQGDGEWR